METISTIVTGIISAMGSFLNSLNPATEAGNAAPAIVVVVGTTLAAGIARKTVRVVKQFGR